jgi:hypothetical protein
VLLDAVSSSEEPTMSVARPASRTPLAALVALALLLLPAAGWASEAGAAAEPGVEGCDGPPARSARVPAPTIEGPTSGGIRTGAPYAASLVPLPDGWVEEEFFISGTARGALYELHPGDRAEYATRILVRRPTDPAAFNGTVVLDWTNVTVPDDTDVNWISMGHTLRERGYAYVAVAAQRLGVEVSPLALKQWDPVRYGSLSHPGDDYSFDIFSQAAEAVLTEQVLGDLLDCVEVRLAVGASQSAGRLKTYITTFHASAQVVDGFLPQISGPSGVRTDLVPVLWLNSQHEIGDAEPMADTDLFRLWEMAGPAHAPNDYSLYTNHTVVKAHTNGLVDLYDPEAAADWGYRQRPGLCVTRNYFQAGPFYSLALVALDDWVRSGEPPAPMPRAERAGGGRVWDEHGNLRGGLRSPLLEVPIATYFAGGVPDQADPCGAVGGRTPLTGTTRIFDAGKLAALYGSGEGYLQAFTAAVDDALAAGHLLPESAEWLLERAPEAAAFVDAAIG